MTRAKRETGEVRYKKILQAALPLFGTKGFAATTTRELSDAAGVSDSLLYKYFPSKAAIYKGLIDFCTVGGTATAEKIDQLEPTTENFVRAIYFLFYIVIFGAPEAKKFKLHLDRLLLQSLAGDGDLAKGFHDSKIDPWIDILIEKGLSVAEETGDVVRLNDSPRNRILFAYHVAFDYLIFQVPKHKPLKYESEQKQIFDEAVLFALRGIGFKPEAIQRYFKPDELHGFVQEFLKKS